MIHLAWTMANVARLLRDRDIVCLADDDQQADALAGALRAALPDHPILFIPSSDALPGDVAPASPANIGSRVAALHALRLAQQTRDRKHLACVLSGEAAARLYPPPDAFDSAPPRLEIGDPVDVGEFAALIEEVGYFADDRVDEPGEMAVRGDVIDIFPADAGQPARIEIVEGKIASIRSFDPVTQLSVTDLERLEIGRAAEPATDKPTAILSHLRPGAILLTEKADKRRRRFLQLAADAASGRDGRLDALADADWNLALSAWERIEFDAAFEPTPRFAQTRSPLAALARFAKPLLGTRQFVLAGCERDLRFLKGRVAKRLGIDLVPVEDWNALDSIPPGGAAVITLPVDSG